MTSLSPNGPCPVLLITHSSVKLIQLLIRTPRMAPRLTNIHSEGLQKAEGNVLLFRPKTLPKSRSTHAPPSQISSYCLEDNRQKISNAQRTSTHLRLHSSACILSPSAAFSRLLCTYHIYLASFKFI